MKESNRYFMEFSYHGKPFHGWQRQPNALTVQQVMEEALTKLIGQETTLTAAGRTDTGVHARKMFAHFDLKGSDHRLNLTHRLNQFLPKDIFIKRIAPVIPEAHARFDAISRSYEYWICLEKNPFMQDLAHYIYRKLDLNAMNTACEYLIGNQDFECFSKAHSDVNTFLCDLTKAEWKLHDSHLLVFHISANRFLRNMVRAIVGTLLEVGMGKRKSEELPELIASKDRNLAGASAPAKGLYLTEVCYPKELFV